MKEFKTMRPMIYKSKLRDARIKRGLTLKQVASMTGYSLGTIERAESKTLYNGTKNDYRRANFWQDMADFYGVSVDELKED